MSHSQRFGQKAVVLTKPEELTELRKPIWVSNRILTAEAGIDLFMVITITFLLTLNIGWNRVAVLQKVLPGVGWQATHQRSVSLPQKLE